jgi:hypothetical protein
VCLTIFTSKNELKVDRHQGTLDKSLGGISTADPWEKSTLQIPSGASNLTSTKGNVENPLQCRRLLSP